MRSYLAIILIGLISCNITDNSKFESLKLFTSKEYHLKDFVEHYIKISIKLIKIGFDLFSDNLDQQKYKDHIEQLKKYLQVIKEFMKQHSIKETLDKFTLLVKQFQSFIVNISSPVELAQYIKEVLEKIKDLPLLKEMIKKIDPSEFAKKIEKILYELQMKILTFYIDDYINLIYSVVKITYDKILGPEEEMITSLKKLIDMFKEILTDESIILITHNTKYSVEKEYSSLKSLNISEVYNNINKYYPIIRMFFLFFEPKKIVDMIRDGLNDIDKFAEKIDAEIVYEYLKKNIEYFRYLLGDDYTEILLNIALVIKEEIKQLSGKIEVDTICNEITELLNDIKNFVLSHDAQYFINEIKTTYNFLVDLTDIYNSTIIASIVKDYLFKVQKQLNNLDDQLFSDFVKEAQSILRDFIKEIEKKKFLGN